MKKPRRNETFPQWYKLHDGLIWKRKHPNFPIEKGAVRIADQPSENHQYNGRQWVLPTINKEEVEEYHKGLKEAILRDPVAMETILMGTEEEKSALQSRIECLNNCKDRLLKKKKIPADYQNDKYWNEDEEGN